MTQLTNMKAHSDMRTRFHNRLFFTGIALTLIILFSSCKKQVAGTEKLQVENTYFRICDKDLDGKEYYSIVFWTKNDLQMEDNGHGHDNDEPNGWHNWLQEQRLKWCNNHDNDHNKWYCFICPDQAACKATPVLWGSVGLTDRTIHFEILTEINVWEYRIEYSKDQGKTFKTLTTLKPKGTGTYSFTIKN